jgi:hypothetical protein
MPSTYVHVKSPMSGKEWMICDLIAFTKVKLTNNHNDPKESVRELIFLVFFKLVKQFQMNFDVDSFECNA